MRAVICEAWGKPGDLKVGELPDPVPGPGEVLIAIEAAGLNFADTLMIQGKYQEKPSFPFSPGLEGAGSVAAVGEGVTRVSVGDRVLAILDHGGFAELALARESDVFVIPDSMDFPTAAGFPITYGTAHGSLVWRAALQPGETLLVHGAAGGVGLAAVEVAKYLGARVIAAASSADKLAIARRHGADDLINYAENDLRAMVREMTAGKGVDVVFDPVGGAAFTQSVRCIGWEGRILVIGFASGDIPSVAANMILVKNFSVIGVVFGEHSARFPDDTRERLSALLADDAVGHFSPTVMKTYALEDARTAILELAERRAMGKIVLTR
jgi:NADPH:quinone reductase